VRTIVHPFVLAVAEEFLDAQVLLDPFEEQLDRPPILVQGRDGQRRQGRVVGQKDQRFPRLWVLEADSPQMLWVVFRDVKAIHRDGLIAHHAQSLLAAAEYTRRAFLAFQGVNPGKLHKNEESRFKSAPKKLGGKPRQYWVLRFFGHI